MFLLRFRRPLAAWIACVAVLAAAWMPALTASIHATRIGPSFLSDICSVAGLEIAKADGQAHDESQPKGDGSAGHCPYCLTHAGSFGLPPPPAFSLPVAAGFCERPALFYRAAHPLFAWTPVQSRAPPGRS